MNDTLMLFSITEHGYGNELAKTFAQNNILGNIQFSGKGTAPSEMMDIFGIGSTDKDVILSIGSKAAVDKMMTKVATHLNSFGRGKGIVMQISVLAINNIVATLLNKNTKAGGLTAVMENQYKHNLILIASNEGYAEQIMTIARENGATGGTIIRARMTQTEDIATKLGIHFSENKDVIAILSPESTKSKIMNAVNAEYGIKSEAQSIICSVPVDKAFKI